MCVCMYGYSYLLYIYICIYTHTHTNTCNYVCTYVDPPRSVSGCTGDVRRSVGTQTEAGVPAPKKGLGLGFRVLRVLGFWVIWGFGVERNLSLGVGFA